MDKDKEKYNKLWDESPMGKIGCGTPLLVATIVAIVLFLSSCATRQKIEYVDRDVIRYETKVQHDTLIQNIHDSVYHTIFQKGDTIYDTKYKERVKYQDRVVVKTDTFYRDSIQVQIKESVVEKQKIPKWCYFCLGFCVLFIIFAFIKLVKWIQTH